MDRILFKRIKYILVHIQLPQVQVGSEGQFGVQFMPQDITLLENKIWSKFHINKLEQKKITQIPIMIQIRISL